MSPSSPIVVLDSGLGGLTVAQAIRRALPDEDIIYFGDTARLPYGSKTQDTISGFVRQIIEYLLPHDPKHVVIACNTATALALASAKASFPELPITGVIEPGAKAAVVAAGARKVPVMAVIATEATARSGAYEQAIHCRRQHARLIMKAAPLLAAIIEEGRTDDDPLVRLALHQYLYPLVRRKMNVLVLGCTHYPVYRQLIQDMVGSDVPVIDSAYECAEDVARRLRKAGMTKPKFEAAASGIMGSFRCFVTDDPARYQRLAPRFLGAEIDEPIRVAPDDLYAIVPKPPPIRMSVSA